jgi:hypothetical protein
VGRRLGVAFFGDASLKPCSMAQPVSFLVAHARPLRRLSDRLRVDIVVLVALHEGRRHQPHIVPLPSQDAAKVMGPASRHASMPIRQAGKVAVRVISRCRVMRRRSTVLPGHPADEVEHRLAEIDAECSTQGARESLGLTVPLHGIKQPELDDVSP